MEPLQPSALWRRFSELCDIPHPSHHLDAVRAYILGVAHEAGLEAETDAVGNVLVRRPASAGREAAPGVILEAHMDMVPQADAASAHCFERDPIRPRLVPKGECAEYPDAELVMATGTTLGADNGIGVAAMLTVLTDPSVEAPALECLFTVDEETGMSGVHGLDPSWLRGRYLLNLDTETEGVVMTGCAGAVDMEAVFKYRMDSQVPEGDRAVRLTLNGLQGGHSGMDIHLGRGNACKLMNRFLKHAVINFEARLASFSGGSLRNAIPREAEAVITVPAEIVNDVLDEVAYYHDLFRYELRGIDDGVRLSAAETELPGALLPEAVQDDLLNSVEACHDGVLRFSPDCPHVVETSSNLASVKTLEDGEARVSFLIRSMNEEMKRALASRLHSVFVMAGARVAFSAAYPGWELPAASPLLAQARAVYADTFGTDVRVESVHCGLECGILSARCPGLDIISFGPTIHHPHSPQESVETESVARFWRYLTALLAALE